MILLLRSTYLLSALRSLWLRSVFICGKLPKRHDCATIFLIHPSGKAAGNTPELRIIPFTPEYAGELGQLHWQVWEETYRGLIPDAYLDTFTPEKWTEKARRDTLSSFLLFADGELAGFASCSDPARESVPVPEASEIVAFYLLRKFQGQGLAGALMRHCLDFCTRPNVVLYVLEGNEKAAGFYRHMGFEPTGRIQLDHTPYGTLRELEMVCRRERKEN